MTRHYETWLPSKAIGVHDGDPVEADVTYSVDYEGIILEDIHVNVGGEWKAIDWGDEAWVDRLIGEIYDDEQAGEADALNDCLADIASTRL